MRLTILGTGTSMGVPVIGCDCAVCNSSDPRDKRTRVSAVVECRNGARLLIDSPPELRLQMISAKIGAVDAVLYTHDHADHVHGIDDLRAISVSNGTLPLYGPGECLERIEQRFDYIFDSGIVPPKGTFKPQLETRSLTPGSEVEIAGVAVTPIAFDHGTTTVFGYRIGDLAYVTDVKRVDETAMKLLRGVKILVLNALFEKPHPTHLSIPEALDVAKEVGAERTFLTHLTHRFSHAELLKKMPAGVEPAHDGLVVPF
ncbi:MAG: MBL fold metallo-hydrolase [Gemmatimonadota bacterium]|nr:MBL fold metallo-hydrolase [Gemmatimonadota bacterium]